MKSAGDFLATLAFQITQDYGQAILFRQPIELVVQMRQPTPTRLVSFQGALGHVIHLPLFALSPRKAGSGLEGRAIGDPIKPTRDGGMQEDRSRFPDEHEKSFESWDALVKYYSRLVGPLSLVTAKPIRLLASDLTDEESPATVSTSAISACGTRLVVGRIPPIRDRTSRSGGRPKIAIKTGRPRVSFSR